MFTTCSDKDADVALCHDMQAAVRQDSKRRKVK